jgi:hypothetical protein
MGKECLHVSGFLDLLVDRFARAMTGARFDADQVWLGPICAV